MSETAWARAEPAARSATSARAGPMVAFFTRSPLVLLVALRALLGLGGVEQHLLELGAVRPVAAQAVHPEIAVPLVPGLFPHGVGGVLEPVVAGGAHVHQDRAGEQERSAPGVCVVAGGAVAAEDRLMLRGRLLLPAQRVAVAASADGERPAPEQALPARGVGRMAVQAGVAPHHRRVEPALVEDGVHLLVV